jgi:hypothetical protein
MRLYRRDAEDGEGFMGNGRGRQGVGRDVKVNEGGWRVAGDGFLVTSNSQPNQNLHFIPNSAAWVKKFCMV